MSDQQTPTMTPVDALICDDQLQAIKACIPFLNFKEQTMFLAITKYMEFQRSIQLIRQDSKRLKACSIQPAMRTPVHMLNHIRTYCSEGHRKTIDALLNSMQMIQLFQTLQSQTTSAEELFSGMLSDEQLQMFREFSETVQQSSQEQGGSYE